MMNLHTVSRDDTYMILAYDQGFEHGPTDFDQSNVDPYYVFDIALHGNYTAIACHAGIAEKYWHDEYQEVPLLVKLNGKTKRSSGDPRSLQHCSVRRAQELGASAVGYTIYLGSEHQQEMFQEFGEIVERAHELGLSTVCWMYPRGTNIDDELATENIAYGARIAHELGADVVKVKDNGDEPGMHWATQNAAKTDLVVAGGSKTSHSEFLHNVERARRFGADGIAVGRNIWQSDKPLKLTAGVRKILFDDMEADDMLDVMT
jgi:class I fructose-bisphosphate aldolase